MGTKLEMGKVDEQAMIGVRRTVIDREKNSRCEILQAGYL